MVNSVMEEKSAADGKSSRSASKEEIKAAIQGALTRLRLKADKDGFKALASKTGLAPNTLYNAFLGHHGLGPAPLHTLRLAGERMNTASRIAENADVTAYVGRLRLVPVLSWAHAGEATCYEELPTEQQERVPTDSEDPQTFALRLVGDCMEPKYTAGDLAIVMPGVERRNGCLVIAKLADDGVLFRRFHQAEDGRVRLTAYNPVYPEQFFPTQAFRWIYPVHSVLKREWR